MGEVRGAQGEGQEKWLLSMLADICAGIVGLGERVVSVPHFDRRIIALVVFGVLVVVRAFEDLPVVEALTAVGRDVVGPSVSIHVPFSYIGRLVAA